MRRSSSVAENKKTAVFISVAENKKTAVKLQCLSVYRGQRICASVLQAPPHLAAENTAWRGRPFPGALISGIVGGIPGRASTPRVIMMSCTGACARALCTLSAAMAAPGEVVQAVAAAAIPANDRAWEGPRDTCPPSRPRCITVPVRRTTELAWRGAWKIEGVWKARIRAAEVPPFSITILLTLSARGSPRSRL